MAKGVRSILWLFVLTLVVGLALSVVGAHATNAEAAVGGIVAMTKTALLSGSGLRWLQVAAGAIFVATALSFVDRLVLGDEHPEYGSSIAQTLRQGRDGAQLLAAVLLLCSAGQLAWLAGSAATRNGELPHADKLVQSVAPMARRIAEAAPKLGLLEDEAQPQQPADGAPMRVMLSVNHPGPRSKVLINDAFVGYTTYMADISCLRGETLVLSIVPPKGKRIDRPKLCEGPTMTLSE